VYAIGRVKDIVPVDLHRIRRRLAQAIQDEVLAAQSDWGRLA
jgi:hypothetical protein